VVGTGSTTSEADWYGIQEHPGWHHLVGTFDGTNLLLYCDGVEVASTTVGSYSPGTYPLSIGADNGYDTGFNDFYPGDIANVAVYPVALTATQVADHYAAASATERGLIQRWSI